jgi:radical SAM superfamily enzyme YgiQ (UPF0313 family)
VGRAVDALLVGWERQENLGLRSILAYLRAQGFRASLVAFDPADQGSVVRAVRRARPRLVGFSIIFQYTLSEFTELARALRASGSDAHFTAGGHFPSLRPATTLDRIPELDSVVRFEGEHTAADLVRALRRGDEWRALEGLACRGPAGVVVNPPRPLAELDRLPWPVRARRRDPPGAVRSAPILASRGCQYDCSFCSIREFYAGARGAPRRTRSPEDVVREMAHLHRRQGVTVFLFQDDDFAMRTPAQRAWLREFLDGLDRAELSGRIGWKISCRVDDLDPSLLARCRERGLLAAYLGVESGSAAGLLTLRKRVTVRQNLEAIRMLADARVAYDLGFMLFDPDSTFDTVRENLRFLRKVSRLDGPPLAFVKMLPLAGTRIERRLAAEGRLEGDEVRPDYRLLDPRLEYFALLVTLVFSTRNSDPDGLVERLRSAYFAALVAERLDGSRRGGALRRRVGRLIREENQSALDLLTELLDAVEALPSARAVALAWPALRARASVEQRRWSAVRAQLAAEA